MIKNFVFGGNYFARGEFVLYINHSGKYIEINFNMKIPFSLSGGASSFQTAHSSLVTVSITLSLLLTFTLFTSFISLIFDLVFDFFLSLTMFF